MISDLLVNVIESFTLAGITAYLLRLTVEAKELRDVCTHEELKEVL